MEGIGHLPAILTAARERAGLTQAEVAAAVGTTQSTIARLEGGKSNPTVATLRKYAAAVGLTLEIELGPLIRFDPVVELYKCDVDRTLLRANLELTVEERLRSLVELQEAGEALERAARRAASCR